MKNLGYMVLDMAMLGAGYGAYQYLGNNKNKSKLKNIENMLNKSA